MENTFPFEYGFFYKVIENPTPEDKDEIQQLYHQQDNLKSMFMYSNYGSPMGTIISEYIDPSGHFFPIAFLEKEQKVVVEIIVSENEILNNLLTLNNNQFSTTEIQKQNKRIRRLSMDVNLFIRNFEKVL